MTSDTLCACCCCSGALPLRVRSPSGTHSRPTGARQSAKRALLLALLLLLGLGVWARPYAYAHPRSIHAPRSARCHLLCFLHA